MEEKQDQEIGILENIFRGVSTAKILDFLLSYREFDYSEADIARYTSTSPRQIYRALPILEKSGLVYQTRISGRSRMYKLNTNTVVAEHLEKLVHLLAQKDVPVQTRLIETENEELAIPQQ